MEDMCANHTSPQMEFQDLFGPMIASWDFGGSSMMEMFETERMGNSYSVETAQLAMEHEPTQNMKSLRELSRWDGSRSTQVGSYIESPILELEKMWFTRFPAPEEESPTMALLSPAQSPSASISDVTDISDQYRHHLSKAILSPLPPDDPLPSSNFLAGYLYDIAYLRHTNLGLESMCADVLSPFQPSLPSLALCNIPTNHR